ncbi:MAG: LysR family transcriptional regulator [Bacteriovorax sp.]|nr:LysR family transcriptional regulator [Bacteriovorax sp.]
MTLEQIITIEAIVEWGSFKAAADALHKSQPSISMAIKKLEEEYQVTLFSRDKYRPTLTNEGRIFFEKAKLVLKEFRALEVMAQQMSKGEEVEIRISIDAVSPVSLILKFLKRFFNNHPMTKLKLSFEVLNGTLERLLEGDVDFAITPVPEGDWEIDILFLTRTKMIPVMRSDLVKNKKITDSFLRDLNQVILADSARKMKKASSGILEGAKSVTLSEISFKKEMILQGLGWGGLPHEMIKSELARKILTPIKTPLIKESSMEIFLVRDKTKVMGPVARELWERMSEEFKRGGGEK